MAHIRTEFVTACVSGRGKEHSPGCYEMPEAEFICRAKQDAQVRTELISFVCDDLICSRILRSLHQSQNWLLIRAELNVLRHLGDVLLYEALSQWFLRNSVRLIREDRSQALGRHTLEILTSWEEPDLTRAHFWFDLLTERTIVGAPIPPAWKQVALQGLIAVDPIIAARRVTYWPGWTQARYHQALKQIWLNPRARLELISAVYEGKYSPFRDAADEIHTALADILDEQQYQELTTELARLHERSDPFRDTPTNPPPPPA